MYRMFSTINQAQEDFFSEGQKFDHKRNCLFDLASFWGEVRK